MIRSRTDDDTAAMNRQLDVEDRSRRPDTDIEMDRQVEEAQEAMLARNPNLRVIRVPDAGHLPWIDDPERVVDEIEHFLSS